MRLPARALLLVWIMVWQTLAWATPPLIDARSSQLQHSVMHEQHIGHHHHADASLQLAVDDEPGFHVHADVGAQPVGLAVRWPDLSLPPPRSVTPLPGSAALTTVYLDGWLRPPRVSSRT